MKIYSIKVSFYSHQRNILMGNSKHRFFFILLFSTVNGTHTHNKILPMTEFELQTPGIRSDRSAT